MNTENLITEITRLTAEYGPRLIGAIAVFIIGSWIIKILTRGFGKILDKRSIDSSLKPFLKSIINVLCGWNC